MMSAECQALWAYQFQGLSILWFCCEQRLISADRQKKATMVTTLPAGVAAEKSKPYPTPLKTLLSCLPMCFCIRLFVRVDGQSRRYMRLPGRVPHRVSFNFQSLKEVRLGCSVFIAG